MIGLVLAAGAGRRLGALTDDLPKTLLPVTGDTSILELTLTNLAAVGIDDVVVVTGHAEHRIKGLQPELEERCGVQLELVTNEMALTWNNAYSLWCARQWFEEGALLCNGDTVHPVAAEQVLLAAAPQPLLLAVDTVKSLAEEEMKVELTASGRLRRINKALDPATAAGEYIGLTLISAEIAPELTTALRSTFERDPHLYYEDAYQELVDRGIPVHVAPVGRLDWVEVDSPEDLTRAREIACRY